ncbi:MAG: hypothetical protein ACRC9R_02060 [Enterovibrio sp.]
MFPNQTSPTTADTDTTPTTTQTAATTQGATGTNVTQAVVSVANTAALPVTTTAGATRRPPAAQGARFHPYTRPIATAPVPLPVAPTAQPQQAAGALFTPEDGASHTDLVMEAHRLGSTFILRRARDTSPVTHLNNFFDAFSKLTGLTWGGQHTGVSVQGRVDMSIVGRGSISASTLSFSTDFIRRCTNAEIKELMERVNGETNEDRRRLLLAKAIRAFSERVAFWHGGLATFWFLLGLNSHSVATWAQTMPSIPTAAVRAAVTAPAPLTLYLPMEVLTWDEIVRFLQERVQLRQRPPSSAADTSTASAPSTVRFFFEDAFINLQEPSLAQLMRDFNQEAECKKRNLMFAKIISILKDDPQYQLPEGTSMHVCEWLKVNRTSVSSWAAGYRRSLIGAAQQNNQPAPQVTAAQMLPPQTRAQRTSAPTLATPPLFMPAATSTAVRPAVTTTATLQPIMYAPVPRAIQQIRLMRAPAPLLTAPPLPTATSTVATPAVMMPAAIVTQTPQLLPMPAVLPATTSTAAALPVFATPVAATSTVTAQLAPVVQPFDPQAMSLDELLEQGAPQPTATEALDINMDLDDEELLGLFED